MGIFSWITGSAPASASPPTRDTNPWRRLYDPGSAPNPSAMEGASAVDKPDSPNAKSVWEHVLQSESFRRKSFDDIDADRDGQITPAELAAAVGPSCSGATAEALVKAADRDGDGRISRREFAGVMDSHFGTA